MRLKGMEDMPNEDIDNGGLGFWLRHLLLPFRRECRCSGKPTDTAFSKKVPACHSAGPGATLHSPFGPPSPVSTGRPAGTVRASVIRTPRSRIPGIHLGESGRLRTIVRKNRCRKILAPACLSRAVRDPTEVDERWAYLQAVAMRREKTRK